MQPPHTADAPARRAAGQLCVYYDGACPLCAAEVSLYRRQDREDRLCLIDVADTGSTLPPGVSREAALARFHIVEADGTLRSGAAAFAAVWRVMPGWSWLGRAAQTPLIGGALEGLYRLFLPVRPLLSGLARRIAKVRSR